MQGDGARTWQDRICKELNRFRRRRSPESERMQVPFQAVQKPACTDIEK